MKKILIYITILSIFSINPYITLASDKDFQNANNLVYNESEIDFVKKTNENIDNNNAKNIKDFIINYNFDLSKHKSKLYTIIIIKKIIEKLAACDIILKDKKCVEFIAEHEFSDKYDDESTWNKIMAWILLKPGSREYNNYSSSELYQMLLRRQKILEKIIEKNPSCAPLSLYLLIVVDGLNIGLNASSKILSQKIEALQSVIDKYPDSEFAAGAAINIVGCYTSCNDIEKASQVCNSIIEKYKNVQFGSNDIYSEMYLDLLNKHIELGNIEKAELFFKLVNINIKDYDIIKYQFTQDIKTLKSK